MEYNLLKTIEPNLQQIFAPPLSIPHSLTSFPARDFVNPGNKIYALLSMYL